MPHVALVEDTKEDSDAYAAVLRESGIEVTQYFTVEEALIGINTNEYDAYILDLEFDFVEYEGLEVADLINRKFSRNRGDKRVVIPILIVSGHAPEEYKKISGNFISAWDYLQKPLKPDNRVIVGMTKKLIRFAEEEQKEFTQNAKNIDIKDGIVRWNSIEVHLSMTLYKMLKLLVTSKNKVVTINELFELTPGHAVDIFAKKNIVKVQIKHLRDAFKDAESKAKVSSKKIQIFNAIRAVPGKGYSWNDDERI